MPSWQEFLFRAPGVGEVRSNGRGHSSEFLGGRFGGADLFGTRASLEKLALKANEVVAFRVGRNQRGFCADSVAVHRGCWRFLEGARGECPLPAVIQEGVCFRLATRSSGTAQVFFDFHIIIFRESGRGERHSSAGRGFPARARLTRREFCESPDFVPALSLAQFSESVCRLHLEMPLRLFLLLEQALSPHRIGGAEQQG